MSYAALTYLEVNDLVKQHCCWHFKVIDEELKSRNQVLVILFIILCALSLIIASVLIKISYLIVERTVCLFLDGGTFLLVSNGNGTYRIYLGTSQLTSLVYANLDLEITNQIIHYQIWELEWWLFFPYLTQLE